MDNLINNENLEQDLKEDFIDENPSTTSEIKSTNISGNSILLRLDEKITNLIESNSTLKTSIIEKEKVIDDLNAKIGALSEELSALLEDNARKDMQLSEVISKIDEALVR